MDFFDILLAKKLEDDRDPKVEGLSVTANGTYSEDGVVYKPVVVNVPETPLSSLSVTANGTYTAPSGTGYNEVSVNVPAPENALVIKNYESVPTSIASFNDGTSNPLKTLTASIVPVQAGSGDPSPTNVRPISGWSGCNIGNLGSKNWYDTRQSLLAGYLNVDGTAGGTGQSINKHTEPIPIKGGITFTYSVAVSRNADQVCLWYDKNNNVIDVFVLLKNTTSITAQAPINAVSTSLTVYNVDGQTIQLEAGSQATAYEPYNPNSTTTTIPFTDSQGNPVEVYGGSVDVVNGGEQQRTLGYVDLGTLDWEYTLETNKERFSAEISGIKWVSNTTPINAICSALDVVDFKSVYSHITDNAIGLWNGTKLAVYSSAYTDATAFKQAMNGVPLVYELATPTTFYTQPTSIKSLDGVNNVFASTGDVEELKYFARATS